MFKNYRLRDYDFKLIILVLALSAVGIMTIGSAEPAQQSRQMAGVAAGVVIMIALSFFNYSVILKLYWLMYIGNLVLLGLVIIMGEEGNGAQRWLKIGGLQFQPSELAKILLILFFAQFIMKYKEKLNTFRVIASIAVLMGVPWIMVLKQPALSTSIVLIFIFCVILYVGGISYKLVFGALAVAIPAVVILVSLAMQPDSTILETYQKNRILAFVNPEEYSTDLAYQQLNSVMAIGSGELDGKGYKNNEITSVKNGNFLSEAETDFIFRRDDYCGGHGGTDRIPEFCKHRSGYIYTPQYGTSFTVCKLRTDIFAQSVYRNGYCTEYSTAGKEKLRIIEEKKGYRI